jgi:hypothetical protein
MRVVVLLGCVAAVVWIAISSAASAPPRVSVYFLRGEQLASAQRAGRTPLEAMRQLIAGPTPAETRRGFRTYLPTGTRVLGVSVANGVATVDLNKRFASGRNRGSLLARLSQVVRTLTGLQGAKAVQLLVKGGIAADRFPGISMSRPITFRFLQTPNVAVPDLDRIPLFRRVNACAVRAAGYSYSIGIDFPSAAVLPGDCRRQGHPALRGCFCASTRTPVPRHLRDSSPGSRTTATRR